MSKLGLKLSNYGSIVSKHECVLATKNSKLLHMEYTDYSTNTYTNVEIKDDNSYIVYTCKNMNTSDKISNVRKMMNANRDLFSFFNNFGDTEWYDWERCKEKDSDNYYTVIFNAGDKDISMTFSKDRAVLYSKKDNTIKVYKKRLDGTIDLSDVLEKYIFTEKGYFCYNTNEGTMSACFDGIFVDYKYITKANIDSRLLYCPTIIEYYYGESIKRYDINYDKNGMVLKLFNESEPNIPLCRCENILYSKPQDYEETLNIHPLLLDSFNYNFIDNPLKYWAQNKLSRDNDMITINRYIYILEKENSERLISDLFNESTYYGIEMDE